MIKKASKRVEADSDTLFGWVNIGAQLMTTNSPLRRLLDGQHMLRRNTPAFNPPTHRALRLESQQLGKGELAAEDLGCALDGSGGRSGTGNSLSHTEQHNAVFVNTANANFGKTVANTEDMAKEGDPSPFWQRLGSVWPKGERFSGPAVAACLKLGDGNGTTGRWQRGETLPRPAHLIQLSEHCKVSIDWLLLGRGPKKIIRWDEETEEMLSLWSQLNDNNRHHVRRTAKHALADQRETQTEATEI